MNNINSNSKKDIPKRILNNFSVDIVQRAISFQQQHSSSIKKLHPKSKFAPEEDELLIELVTNMIHSNNNSQYSQNEKNMINNENKNDGKNILDGLSPNSIANVDWNQIALNMKTARNARQCRERYLNYLSPLVGNGPWTLEEEELLREKYNEFGPRWKKISAFFPTRTDINVKSHYHLLERRIRKEEKKKTKALQRQKELEEITQNQQYLTNKTNFDNTKCSTYQITPDAINILSTPLPFLQPPCTPFYGNFPQCNDSNKNEFNEIQNTNNNELNNQTHIQNNQQESKNNNVSDQQIKTDEDNINLSPLPFFSFTAQEEEREFESNSNECWNSLLMNDEANDTEIFLERWF